MGLGARKALEVIGPAFRMAHLNGLIDSNPVERIRRPKAANRKRKKEIPTPEEVEKIVIAAYEQGGVWWGYFVELTAVLGLRRAETCALRWEDFTFPASEDAPVGRIRVVRAVAKMDGGTYIKLPKGGIEREVLVDRSLYDGLGYFDGKEGWLFGGRDVLPRRDTAELTPTSTAGRLVLLLDERGGELSCSRGRAGAEARRAIGTNSATMSEVSRSLEAAGYIERDTNARRTFRLSLTARGRDAAAELADVEVTSKPVHPDTASHRFAELIDRLGLQGESGRPYTLHSLRHFRATYLYNVTKDWVQVARYLGHASPAITMDLYANNVVETTQLDLARAAVRLTASTDL